MEKKYTKYDAIDFAEDPSFIRWVQGGDQKAIAFWEKWEIANPDKSAALQEAKILVQSIQIIEEEPNSVQINNLWDKIDKATEVEQKTVETTKTETIQEAAVIRSLSRRRWIGVAAAACVGLLAFLYLYQPSTTIGVGKGDHLAYTLPDNSNVELNAASNISFKKGNFREERIVHLEGEAFFEVAKGQSFKVITPNGTVEVLGTSFNVNTRNGNLAVDCRTGKVRVSAKRSSEVLTKGQGTKLNAQKTALEPVYTTDIAKQTGWIKGDFYFVDNNFSTVLSELERQYNVQIDCPMDLKQKRGDYTFKGGNLKKALDHLVYQLNADYTINGQQVNIMKK